MSFFFFTAVSEIHLQCTGMEAEISEVRSGISKSGQIKLQLNMFSVIWVNRPFRVTENLVLGDLKRLKFLLYCSDVETYSEGQQT